MGEDLLVDTDRLGVVAVVLRSAAEEAARAGGTALNLVGFLPAVLAGPSVAAGLDVCAQEWAAAVGSLVTDLVQLADLVGAAGQMYEGPVGSAPRAIR
ncbi:hypothetical protein D1871_20940 [Nakamurella silvestris]|nr:hypothetical protein D1871_20940 [Nakamurella silvestris]